jgi:hypothetical protein
VFLFYKGGAKVAFTLEDFVKLNPYYKKRYDPGTKTGYLSNTKTGKEISFLEGQGQQYGFGGLEKDSHIISDPGRLISALSAPAQTQTKPSYQSPYSDKIGTTLAAIQNRGSFNYDPSSDVGLQAAQESASDTVSRAAARRGMLYSDSNKSQMGKSALALVPQFEQTAFNRYQQEGQSLQDQINMLLGLENQAYGQYRDTVGDELNERQFGLSEAGLTGRYQDMPTLSALQLQMANDRQAEMDELTRQKWAASPESDPRYRDLSLRALEAEIAATGRSNRGGGGSVGLTANQRAQLNQDAYNMAIDAAKADKRLADTQLSPTGQSLNPPDGVNYFTLNQLVDAYYRQFAGQQGQQFSGQQGGTISDADLMQYLR